MSDFPVTGIPPLPTIHTWSYECLGVPLTGMALLLSAQASAVYPTANLAIYLPFGLATIIKVTKLWWYNGATLSGNVDVGIYDSAGRRLISTGSTAQAGTASRIQAVDVTDTLIGPGDFYLAIAASATTVTLFRIALGNALFGKAFGILQQATAFPLPATATFATTAQTFVPEFGLLHGRAFL